MLSAAEQGRIQEVYKEGLSGANVGLLGFCTKQKQMGFF